MVLNILPSSLSHLIGKGKQSWYEDFMYWYWSSNSYLLFKLSMSKIELIIYKLLPPLVFSISCSEQGHPSCHSGLKPVIYSSPYPLAATFLWMATLQWLLPFSLSLLLLIYKFLPSGLLHIFLITFAAYIPFHKIYWHQNNLPKVINLKNILLYS